ncbi:hypothetical protein O0S10_02680 [Methanocorpusculum sp. MG]|uniref:Lipoprotein n=1 Tax=Methanocorpusculum petauri TaxID=3002863 RepID=A0ABT4IEH3_9EURY|nr:hypothetical protein [Methanocorpusculum petauri]MCZ0860135.1 hypothetical protein [Methanocorpusculum petauri]
MKSHIIFPVLICVLVVFSSGCIQMAGPHGNVTATQSEEHYWTVGFFDKGVYRHSNEIADAQRMAYMLEWQFDLENSTGFVMAEKRNSTENRVPVFILKPGTTGSISLKVVAPQENDLTISVSPETDLPEGVTIVLENTSVTIPAGRTLLTSLHLSMEKDVTRNDRNMSCIWLETTQGMGLGRWCQILTSADPHIPEIDAGERVYVV